jgi:hypothetical protein
VNKRYQEFKTAVANIRRQITSELGKTITPYEGQLFLDAFPTGDESGGPTAFLTKLDNAEKVLGISREIRLELARTGKGQIDMAELDKRLRAQFTTPGGDTLPKPQEFGLDAIQKERARRKKGGP